MRRGSQSRLAAEIRMGMLICYRAEHAQGVRRALSITKSKFAFSVSLKKKRSGG